MTLAWCTRYVNSNRLIRLMGVPFQWFTWKRVKLSSIPVKHCTSTAPRCIYCIWVAYASQSHRQWCESQLVSSLLIWFDETHIVINRCFTQQYDMYMWRSESNVIRCCALYRCWKFSGCCTRYTNVECLMVVARRAPYQRDTLNDCCTPGDVPTLSAWWQIWLLKPVLHIFGYI